MNMGQFLISLGMKPKPVDDATKLAAPTVHTPPRTEGTGRKKK